MLTLNTSSISDGYSQYVSSLGKSISSEVQQSTDQYWVSRPVQGQLELDQAVAVLACVAVVALCDKAPVYAPPPPAYAPAPSYHAPEPAYHAPEPAYHAPEPAYHAPKHYEPEYPDVPPKSWVKFVYYCTLWLTPEGGRGSTPGRGLACVAVVALCDKAPVYAPSSPGYAPAPFPTPPGPPTTTPLSQHITPLSLPTTPQNFTSEYLMCAPEVQLQLHSVADGYSGAN
ncbi:pollen-specific leucine-rich repeat extensin-like protein 3 [Penaeus japonicus]|uniref:pollen-specific leucine-rich repeat extensin-like protein 3 n=1 Tax=Penaeus japonicus TaxID=27405 RepID=UPI001C70EA31|nr:pollen-specific leucine-rich repeat extensin-like protein 3 [Penaeus japonicus]